MICPICNTNNPEGSKFCSSCGQIIVNDSLPKITISRVKKLWGFAVSFQVYVDNQLVGSLANGGNIVVEVSPGKHMVRLSLLGSQIEESIELNDQQKNVVLTIKPKMGLLAARPYLVSKVYN